MKLLEDIIIEYDIIPNGSKIKVIDEGVMDWLQAIGTGIKHVGRFALKLIDALSKSGISQTDIEKMSNSEIPAQLHDKIVKEIELYDNKYNIKETTRNVIINLIKMRYLDPELRDNADKALLEITKKLKLKDEGTFN